MHICIGLLLPLFHDVTVTESDQLTLICVNRCPSLVSSFEIFDPSGTAIRSSVGILNVPNVTMMYAGTYKCVVTSKINSNTSVTETAKVTVAACKLVC